MATWGPEAWQGYLLDKAVGEPPVGQLAHIDDVGIVCAGLAIDASALLTGHTVYVDCGLHIMG